VTSVDLSSLELAVGHATDERGATGLTVIRGVDGPMRGGACLFGRASGSRELATLDPTHAAGRVDAILLTGGSAYGLEAAAGVMRWMEERKRGYDVGVGVVPIVPAAVIFDLALGSAQARPTADMAYAACDGATSMGFAEGSVGAGAGATVGKGAGREFAMKGGFGAAMRREGEIVVGALAVVNALGDVRSSDGRILAGARDRDGRFLDSAATISRMTAAPPRFAGRAGENTTLCVVATNAVLDRGELTQLARAAGAALFRRITPAGTSFDGDVVFALCPMQESRGAQPLLPIEVLAAAALEESIERAVRTATGRDGVSGLADRA